MRYKRPVHQCPDCDARGNSLSSHYLATGRGKPVMVSKELSEDANNVINLGHIPRIWMCPQENR